MIIALTFVVTVVAAARRNPSLSDISTASSAFSLIDSSLLVVMSGKGQVKVPPPRPLTNSETTHTLSQWKINFRQYCKRDDSYRHFLKSTTSWDASQTDYGFTGTIGGREAKAVADDLEDFLHMLASFLPHGYITDKIVTKSTSFETAFLIIEENFGLIQGVQK